MLWLSTESYAGDLQVAHCFFFLSVSKVFMYLFCSILAYSVCKDYLVEYCKILLIVKWLVNIVMQTL